MTDSSIGQAITGPACSPRIPIMPVRYAIVHRHDDAPHFRYHDSGFNLEQGFPRLRHSAYTLRALRPGYVYVFMKGCQGEKLVIHEYNGEGRYKELRYTGLENYERPEKYRTGQSMGWVWAQTTTDTTSEVWIGYSPHLWTTAMTRRILASAQLRKRHMRQIDVAELVSGDSTPSAQPHVLPASALGEWVEDFKLAQQRPYLDWSSFFSQEGLYPATFASMARHYPYTQSRVPAVVVLNDAEGISLDLGLSVSAYQHQLRDPMVTGRELNIPPESLTNSDPDPAPDPIPGCFRLDADRISPASREFHHKNLVSLLLEKTLESFYPGDPGSLDQQAQEQARTLELQTGRPQSAAVLRYSRLTDAKHSEQGARLGQRIDTDKYHTFLREREALEEGIRILQRIIEQASADHDAWLVTAESPHIDDPTSLAAAHASYDRDNFHSACTLEISLALTLDAMAQVLPGAEHNDARVKRLERWLDQQDSPMYLALAPFNPFRDKADAIGTLLGGSDASLEALAARFPAVSKVTDLTAHAVSTVVLKRLNGKTRWDASRTLRQQVLAAAREANAEKALGLLGARYEITSRLTVTDPFTQEIDSYLKSGMAHVEEIRQTRITGSRIVTVESTTTLQVKPNFKAFARTSASGALNVGLLWYNLINLKTAHANLQNDPEPEYVAGFASAVFAVIGATGSMLVAARSLQMMTVAQWGKITPGTAFGSGVVRFLGSRLFARLAGYPTIALGLASDALKAKRQYNHGDSTASLYTASAGVLSTLGALAILEGSLAISGASLIIPVAGWAAAAIILAGSSVLIGGLALHAKASERLHNPIELWAVRSLFGTRLNDGEDRSSLYLTEAKKLRNFNNLADEVESWHSTYYAPILLSNKNTKELGIPEIYTRWHNEAKWSVPDRETIVQPHLPENLNVAEFAILLRGFIIDQSKWSVELNAQNPETKIIETLENAPTCYITTVGLVLHIKKNAQNYRKIILTLEYTPNQGLGADTVIKTHFQLERLQ